MKRKQYPRDQQTHGGRSSERRAPSAKGGRTGKPREHSLREIWNAIFYQGTNGCSCCALPHDLPWFAVWHQYLRWRDNGTLETVHAALREQVRRNATRSPTPSAALLDSQSMRVAEGGC